MNGECLVADDAAPPSRCGQEALGVSRMRWYVLSICSCIAGMQGGYWNNFGPIAPAVKPFFGWQDADIAMLANWGPIMFLCFAFPFAWLMDSKGVKWSCVVSAVLLFIGSLCRVVYVEDDLAGRTLMHAGQLLNAIPGPVAMGIGPVMSATWFPPHERTTATAICSVFNYGGNAVTFAFGPLLVKQDADVQRQLRLYMVYECFLAGLLAIGSFFVPSHPPFPPSASARVERTVMQTGCFKLSRQHAFWSVAVSYGLIVGFLGPWGAMLAPNMQNVLPADVAEDDAGWMGFWGAIAGMAVGIVFGIHADSSRASGRKKPLILKASAACSLLYFIFACLCSRLLGGSATSVPFVGGLYATSILAALISNAMIPLFFEMAVEAAYPVAEGLTTTILTVVSNIASLAFLGVQSLPGIGTQWMNWACAIACFSPLLFITPVAERRHRLEYDQTRSDSLSPVKPATNVA